MSGRVTTLDCRVALGDVRPDASQRLDALARVVQDVADRDYATLAADGIVVEGMGMWVLRRLALDIDRTLRMRDECTARTWIGGIGARWVERRTEIAVGGRPCVEATAVWVHVDPERRAPVPIPPAFGPVWFPERDGRRVSARLSHPRPPAGATRHDWPVRAVDIDVLGHVNNAAYWAAAEEELARRGRPRVHHAEIEFGAGIEPGEPVEALFADSGFADSGFADRGDVHGGGFMCWLAVGEEVRASMLVGCRS